MKLDTAYYDCERGTVVLTWDETVAADDISLLKRILDDLFRDDDS